MKLNKSTLVLGIVTALLAIPATSAKAQLFDFQFVYPGADSGLAQSGAAVLGSSADPTWNNLNSTTPTDTTGTVDFTFTETSTLNYGGNGVANPDADPGTGNLFSANLYNPGNIPITYTIGGLANNQAYTLVLYAGGSGANPANYTITGASTYTTYNSSDSYSIANGAGNAYAEVNVISSATGTLAVDESTASGGYTVANGFQLQAESTPEPSTWALLGLGGAVLLFVRNRKKLQSL
jgi:hypothetical protein